MREVTVCYAVVETETFLFEDPCNIVDELRHGNLFDTEEKAVEKIKGLREIFDIENYPGYRIVEIKMESLWAY